MAELLTVAVVGLIGVGGTALGQWLQAWTRRRERTEDLRRQNWEAKRASYEALAHAVDLVDSAAGGAIYEGSRVPDETAQQFTSARVTVELHAEREVWAKIRPAVEATALRANALWSAPVAREAIERLQQLGGQDADGRERLRAQMLAAMRDDLQS